MTIKNLTTENLTINASLARKHLQQLLDKTGAVEVESWEHSRLAPCLEGGLECRDENCSYACENGMYRNRGNWVNAESVWVAEVGYRHLIICLYTGIYTFYTLTLADEYIGGVDWVSMEEQDSVGHKVHASSDFWDGDYCGSGIPRHPETLRGFMYRTPVNGADGHILPDDVVAYLESIA